MKDSNGTNKLNAQILEEASAWFVEFSEGDVRPPARQDFNRWLRMSPEHVRAYLQVSTFWEDAPLLGKSRTLSADELIARARASTNVVPMEVGTRTTSERRRIEYLHSSVRPRLLAIAASIALAAVGLTLWMQSVRGTYSTGVGEQRSITLSDGSTIELNARSRVRVRFRDAERTVHLLEGQALFHVAKDVARPFVVRSEETRVRAVGTQFDVNRTRIGTIVTVLEGRVAVLPSESDSPSNVPGRGATNAVGMGTNPLLSEGATRSGEVDRSDQTTSVYLDAGEQVTVTGTASHRPTHTDPAAATAWRQRKLQFASASLTEVADEYNRYHEQRLIVRDPRLESFHISGVFSATDNASLLAFLRQQPSLNVRATDSEIEITSK